MTGHSFNFLWRRSTGSRPTRAIAKRRGEVSLESNATHVHTYLLEKQSLSANDLQF
jgi:hypothetical protein